MKQKPLVLLSLLCFCIPLLACGQTAAELTTAVLSTEHELKFGGAYICISIEDFCALGFAYGDSVDIAFSNGHRVEDVPFYNGYYGRTGEVLLCAYPGYPYVKACINNGGDLFEQEELDEGCTAVITLHTAGKYRSIQDALSLVYTTERSDYGSDEIFANFRPMEVGGLKTGTFYRSASPCDNEYGRAECVDALCRQAGIAYCIDLAENKEELASCYGNGEGHCPYWQSLYAAGKVLPLDMSMNYRNEVFAAAVVRGMESILQEEGPYLIHCLEGKDRTGVFCFVLEALAGASYEELRDDYMETFVNYYGLDPQSQSYAAVINYRFDDIALYFSGAEDVSEIKTAALGAGAEKYLTMGGMSAEKLAALKAAIQK